MCRQAAHRLSCLPMKARQVNVLAYLSCTTSSIYFEVYRIQVCRCKGSFSAGVIGSDAVSPAHVVPVKLSLPGLT